jgi:hypothetical protein
MKFRKSHRQPRCTLQLTCGGRVLSVWVELHAFLRGQQHQNAGELFDSCMHLSFVNFTLHPTPQTKILTGIGLETQTALSRLSFTIRHMFVRTFFLTMTDTGNYIFTPLLRSRKTSRKSKSRKLNTNLPFKTMYFLGVMQLTTWSYIVYDYTTGGHTHLQSMYVQYMQCIHNYIQYTYISVQYLHFFLMQ